MSINSFITAGGSLCKAPDRNLLMGYGIPETTRGGVSLPSAKYVWLFAGVGGHNLLGCNAFRAASSYRNMSQYEERRGKRGMYKLSGRKRRAGRWANLGIGNVA